MNNQDFDRLVESIRRDVPDSSDAAERVRQKLNDAAPASALCASFRADFAAMRSGALGEARRMLLEDHQHSCVACRREFSGEGHHVVAMPRRSSAIRAYPPCARACVGANDSEMFRGRFLAPAPLANCRNP